VFGELAALDPEPRSASVTATEDSHLLSVDHDLLIKAVEANTDDVWVVLYIKRWLKAPLEHPDGTLQARDRGTPQGVSGLTGAGKPVHALCLRCVDGSGTPRRHVLSVRG